MVTIRPTFFSVVEQEERQALKPGVEGREDDDAYKERTRKPGEAAGGRTPAHQLPHSTPRSATGRGDAHGPGVTAPMVTSTLSYRPAKCGRAGSANYGMICLAGLGVFPRYCYQLGHKQFLKLSFDSLCRVAKLLSHRGTILLAGLGVLPRYIWSPLHFAGR